MILIFDENLLCVNWKITMSINGQNCCFSFISGTVKCSVNDRIFTLLGNQYPTGFLKPDSNCHKMRQKYISELLRI